MRKSVLFSGAMLLALATGAFAQQGNNNRNNQNGGGGGTLPLPEGVNRVISIDAHNYLLAEVDRDGKTGLAPIIIRHVYSGGIAKIFGGTTVPTNIFISPGAMGGNGGAQTGFGGGGGNTGGFNTGNTNNGGFGNANTNAGGFGNGNFGAFQFRPNRRN